MRIHHVGFVVVSIRDSVEGFARSTMTTWDGRIYHDPNQRVNVTFLQPCAPQNPQVELVEPAGADAPVAAFLKRGGGLHHLCYEVDDLESALRASQKTGALVVRKPVPAVAFDGRRIAWIYTREKLLIEYLERNASSTSVPELIENQAT